MKLLLDACVIFPTILREILMDLAQAGSFEPLWSERILQEWVHAAGKLGPTQSLTAGAEAAMMRLNFPKAMIAPGDEAALGVDLPDAGDLHVLRAAMDGGADQILTFNLRDFPRRALAHYALSAVHPDEYLADLTRQEPSQVAVAVERTLNRARQAGGDLSQRDMLARARLPRLSKALARVANGPRESGILEDGLDGSANDG